MESAEQKEISELRQRVSTLEQKLKSQCEKCDYITEDFKTEIHETRAIVESMRELAINITALTEQVKHMTADIGSMQKKLEAVASRPADNWGKLVAAGISAAVGGIISLITFVLTK